ncbi:hypothetical protein JHK85_046603 [Glycine max]|nr:hypothetical protein JHK85_046603 [Glycine max]
MCLEETGSVIGVAAGLARNIVTGMVEGTVMMVGASEGAMSGVGFVGKIEVGELFVVFLLSSMMRWLQPADDEDREMLQASPGMSVLAAGSAAAYKMLQVEKGLTKDDKAHKLALRLEIVSSYVNILTYI